MTGSGGYDRGVEVDAAGWSGEGDFTQRLIEAIGATAGVQLLKVEDAPASRADAGFSFISNELFVVFETVPRTVAGRRFGIVPVSRTVHEKRLTLAGLRSLLAVLDDVGEPDYDDQGMLQYPQDPAHHRALPDEEPQAGRTRAHLRGKHPAYRAGRERPKDKWVT